MNDKFPNLPSTSKSSAVALRDKQKSHRQKGEIRSWNRIKKDLNAMNYEQSLAFLERNYTSLLSKLQLTTCKYNILKAKLFSLQSEIENTETQLNKSRTVIRQIKDLVENSSFISKGGEEAEEQAENDSDQEEQQQEEEPQNIDKNVAVMEARKRKAQIPTPVDNPSLKRIFHVISMMSEEETLAPECARPGTSQFNEGQLSAPPPSFTGFRFTARDSDSD